MRKRPHFRCVALEGSDLSLERLLDIDEVYRCETCRLSPFGAGQCLEAVDGANARAGQWPASGGNRVEHHAMVDVAVGGAVRIDDVRLDVGDCRLDALHHVKARDRVHAVVGKSEEAGFPCAENCRRATGAFSQLLQRIRRGWRPRCQALCADDDIHAVSLGGVARDGSTRSKHFVVRVGSHDQDVHWTSASVISVSRAMLRAARRPHNSLRRAVGMPVPGRFPPRFSADRTSPSVRSRSVQTLR